MKNYHCTILYALVFMGFIVMNYQQHAFGAACVSTIGSGFELWLTYQYYQEAKKSRSRR